MVDFVPISVFLGQPFVKKNNIVVWVGLRLVEVVSGLGLGRRVN